MGERGINSLNFLKSRYNGQYTSRVTYILENDSSKEDKGKMPRKGANV